MKIIKQYCIIKIGNTKNISIFDLLPLFNEGGYRTDEQIFNLRESITKNGITESIEIYKKVMEHMKLKMKITGYK